MSRDFSAELVLQRQRVAEEQERLRCLETEARKASAGRMCLAARTTERVFCVYGALPWPGGLFFVLRPEAPGHQWRRDFLPALRRYLVAVTGQHSSGLISGIDGFSPEQEEGYIARALAGETSHHWAWYDPGLREVVPIGLREGMEADNG